MNRHVASGRHAFGMSLALMTALMWGALPVILKVLLRDIDPYTLTWCRFLVALLIIGPLTARSGELGPLLHLRGVALVLLVVCALCMTGNFSLYLAGLRHIPPSTAQIVMQLSPVFVLLGGLIVFRESFSRLQFFGFVVLFAGMALFFNQRYGELVGGLSSYGQGLLITALSAFFWSTFSLTQKQLLSYVSGGAILTTAYAAGVVVLFPFIHLEQLHSFTSFHVLLFVVSVFLTLSSYLFFAEALRHLEASRTGVIVALTPLLTVAIAALAALFTDAIEIEKLNALALFGAVVVVAGSICASLGRK